MRLVMVVLPCCISFDSYIKPQHTGIWQRTKPCCISFDSYIKPQLPDLLDLFGIVVYLLIPTSNHNFSTALLIRHRVVYLLIPTSNHNYWAIVSFSGKLYIFWFLHQTTTGRPYALRLSCCISFDSYIKPQHKYTFRRHTWVVYLLIPTSNHNYEHGMQT